MKRMRGSKREFSETETQKPQRRPRVQFAPETKTHDAGASPGAFASLGPHGDSEGTGEPRAAAAAAAEQQQDVSEADVLESKYTKETVEDLRRRKRALAVGVGRLGLGARAADFDISDSAAAANAAGEADPDEADAGEVPLEPFNMRREMQEGAFDSEGTFLWRKKNPDEVRDPWLDSLGDEKPNISDAVRERYAANGDDASGPEVSVDIVSSLRSILSVLHSSETPSRALRRLAEGGPHRGAPTGEASAKTAATALKGKSKKSRVLPALAAAAEREAAAAAAEAAEREAAAAAADGEAPKETVGVKNDFKDKQEAFDALTETCTALLATGTNVYWLTKSQIEEMLQREESANAAEKDASSAVTSSYQEREEQLWQFRWMNNPQDKQIHGPYASSAFRSWIQENFISDSNPVEVRRVSAANDPLDGVWLPWRSADFRSEEQAQRESDLQEETEAQWEAEEDVRLAREARGRDIEDADDDAD